MIFSLPYCLAFIFILLLEFYPKQCGAVNAKYVPCLSVLFFLLVFVGFRGFIVTDWVNYYPYFEENVPSFFDGDKVEKFISSWPWEKGFLLYSVAMKSICPNYFFFQFFSFLFDLIAIHITFRRYVQKKYIFRFVTLSKGCHKEMKDCYNLDSIVMYNPYIFDKKEIDFSEKENTVLYAGRLSPEKDVRLMLDSWKLLKNSNNWKLKIIGDGNQKEFLENYVHTEQIFNVEFLGVLSHDEVLKEFQKSKIFMLVSFFEGFPTVISEAMNYKNVPLVTRYEGFSDELLKYNNSFICSRNLVEISEKLETLMFSADVLKSFAENGYSQCRKFYDFLEKQNYNLGEYK